MYSVNKFGGRVQEVRLQVRFFNAFLADSERPSLPERPKDLKPKEAMVEGFLIFHSFGGGTGSDHRLD